jgi:protease I
MIRLVVAVGLLAAAAVSAAPAQSPRPPLQGCRVVILLAAGYHEHEFWFPYYRFREAGAEVVVAGPVKGTVLGEGRNGKDGLPAVVSHTIDEIKDQRFDLVYLPGGIWAPLKLRHDRSACDFVRQALRDEVLVAAICHASWVLVSADVVRGKKIACPEDMAVDVTNAGGVFVKDKCVQDGNLITAIYFACLPEQFQVLMPALEQRLARKRPVKTGQ